MVNTKTNTVLIIDDEPDICEALELALGMEGFDVKVAQEREAALKVLSDASPAVVFVDYRMPGLQMAEFLERVQKSHPDVPVILMTAGKDPGDKARELGLQYYLSKPFDLDTMLKLVRKCMA